MNLKEINFSLKVVTDIVPIEQKDLLDDLVNETLKDLSLDYIAHNEYDIELEEKDNSTHVYYNVFITIKCNNLKDTLEFIVELMKDKNTIIKYIELEDKYISTEEVQK